MPDRFAYEPDQCRQNVNDEIASRHYHCMYNLDSCSVGRRAETIDDPGDIRYAQHIGLFGISIRQDSFGNDLPGI
jgi:hypothetical protein